MRLSSKQYPTLKRIHAIIFDLDGTLIDSSEGVVEAVNHSLRTVGDPEQPAERIKPYIGFPLSQMYPAFSSAPIADLYRHFQEKARETVVASTVPLPGVEETLDQLLRYDVVLGIASTKIRVHIDGILTKLKWEDVFTDVVGGDEVTRVKPHPDAFLLALDRLGTSADVSLVVGDTINDILAAKAVPIEAVGVVSPYGDDHQLREAGPDHVIECITDLLSLLKPRLRLSQESA